MTRACQLMWVAALAAAPAFARDGGASDGGYDPAQPASWRLAEKLAKGSAAREALTADLTARRGAVGEQALTLDEVDALLDDPRAQAVYGEKTVSIVAPSMVARQRQDHLDLMKLFLKPERLQAGATFAVAHQQALDAAESRHHVDREVIIGILMWETKLGTITGDFVAFNVFTSQAYFIDEASAVALSKKAELAQADPAKQAQRVATIKLRAQKNLLALVRQCKARGLDVLSVKGSWAGALGYPQFMPASLQWAEDGNADGRIDLFDFDDSIASVGRYLEAHGFAQSRQKAVWGYNHEDAYVQGVLAFGDALHELLHPDGGVVAAAADAGR